MKFRKVDAMPTKIKVVVPENILMNNEKLIESTCFSYGRYTARRDPPHFHGDVYHAHVDIPGGYEVSWNISGARRHEGKFPAKIPKDAIMAVANVLKIDQELLESSKIYDRYP